MFLGLTFSKGKRLMKEFENLRNRIESKAIHHHKTQDCERFSYSTKNIFSIGEHAAFEEHIYPDYILVSKSKSVHPFDMNKKSGVYSKSYKLEDKTLTVHVAKPKWELGSWRNFANPYYKRTTYIVNLTDGSVVKEKK